jgi:hypothetical protein
MFRRLLAVALLAACSRQTPDEQLKKDFEPVKSWAATIQLTGERWHRNSVPAAFVRATIAAAEKEYESAAQSIDQSSAGKDLRDQLKRELDADRTAAQRLKGELP